jgi:hypothetical protein
MNAMHALRFFLEIICGVACAAAAAAWVMLFFLRRKVREKREILAAREAQEATKAAPKPHAEMASH